MPQCDAARAWGVPGGAKTQLGSGAIVPSEDPAEQPLSRAIFAPTSSPDATTAKGQC